MPALAPPAPATGHAAIHGSANTRAANPLALANANPATANLTTANPATANPPAGPGATPGSVAPWAGSPVDPAVRAGRPGPIPGDPAAGERVLPAGTWPVRWRHHDGLELGALRAAVPCARTRARAILREWGLTAFGPDAEAIIAELAANAIDATRAGAARGEGDASFRLWMLGDQLRLLILVWDTILRPPVPGTPGSEQEHGRGLLLVEALAARWRWYYPARPYGGKVVWALLEDIRRPVTRAIDAAAADGGDPGGSDPGHLPGRPGTVRP
jgi:hypothetical protein